MKAPLVESLHATSVCGRRSKLVPYDVETCDSFRKTKLILMGVRFSNQYRLHKQRTLVGTTVPSSVSCSRLEFGLFEIYDRTKTRELFLHFVLPSTIMSRLS